MTEDEMRQKVFGAIRSVKELGGNDAAIRHAATLALRIALPWAREQALREAANNMRARRLAEQLMRDAARHDDGREDIATMHSDRAQAFTEAEKALLALISARPSQETTEG